VLALPSNSGKELLFFAELRLSASMTLATRISLPDGHHMERLLPGGTMALAHAMLSR
jgi:hypothetical protein